MSPVSDYSMRYENHTLTQIRLVSDDVRNAEEKFVVIGREPQLRLHYQSLTRQPFESLGGVFDGMPVQVTRSADRSLNVMATTLRPSASSKHQQYETRRIQSAIEYPLIHQMLLNDATEVAMIPISCRAPTVVAMSMIRVIWDISVAAFLDVGGPLKHLKPVRFTIYCITDLQPFIDVLEHGRYASINHGWLFNTEVQCHRAKRARYLARGRFKFRRVIDG